MEMAMQHKLLCKMNKLLFAKTCMNNNNKNNIKKLISATPAYTANGG